jgi:CHASE2 domain-containing sensor protein
MLRLIISVFLAFFFGVLLSCLDAFIGRGKGGFSSQTAILLFGLVLVGALLFFTCPRRKKLHLFLAMAAFSALGFLMASQEIFVHGTGRCSPATFAVCSAGLALVITYGGK